MITFIVWQKRINKRKVFAATLKYLRRVTSTVNLLELQFLFWIYQLHDRTWMDIAGNTPSNFAKLAILLVILPAIFKFSNIANNIVESAILLVMLTAILLNIQLYCWQYCWLSNIAKKRRKNQDFSENFLLPSTKLNTPDSSVSNQGEWCLWYRIWYRTSWSCRNEALSSRRRPDTIEKDQRPKASISLWSWFPARMEVVRSTLGVIAERIPSQGGWCLWCRIEWWCKTTWRCWNKAIPSRRRPDIIEQYHRSKDSNIEKGPTSITQLIFTLFSRPRQSLGLLRKYRCLLTKLLTDPSSSWSILPRWSFRGGGSAINWATLSSLLRLSRLNS